MWDRFKLVEAMHIITARDRRQLWLLRAGRTVKAEAKQDFDFDTFLMDTANKFEQAENKPVGGWVGGHLR